MRLVLTSWLEFGLRLAAIAVSVSVRFFSVDLVRRGLPDPLQHRFHRPPYSVLWHFGARSARRLDL